MIGFCFTGKPKGSEREAPPLKANLDTPGSPTAPFQPLARIPFWLAGAIENDWGVRNAAEDSRIKETLRVVYAGHSNFFWVSSRLPFQYQKRAPC